MTNYQTVLFHLLSRFSEKISTLINLFDEHENGSSDHQINVKICQSINGSIIDLDEDQNGRRKETLKRLISTQSILIKNRSITYWLTMNHFVSGEPDMFPIDTLETSNTNYSSQDNVRVDH